jgi:hypothetical protein
VNSSGQLPRNEGAKLIMDGKDLEGSGLDIFLEEQSKTAKNQRSNGLCSGRDPNTTDPGCR